MFYARALDSRLGFVDAGLDLLGTLLGSMGGGGTLVMMQLMQLMQFECLVMLGRFAYRIVNNPLYRDENS